MIGSTRDQWRRNCELVLRHHSAHGLKQLHYLQAEIIKIVTERRVEVDMLHKRVRGHKKAKKIIAQINGRWKQLNNLVKKYNAAMCNVGHSNLRQLSAPDI